METPAVAQETKQSASRTIATTWTVLTNWLSKLFIVIAMVLAFIVIRYVPWHSVLPSYNDNEIIRITAVGWLVAFIIVYAFALFIKVSHFNKPGIFFRLAYCAGRYE